MFVKAGNYSQLIVNFELEREVGHYIMDYYVPSIMLVVVSWVSFWLDPNAVPGRTTLGKSNYKIYMFYIFNEQIIFIGMNLLLLIILLIKY